MGRRDAPRRCVGRRGSLKMLASLPLKGSGRERMLIDGVTRAARQPGRAATVPTARPHWVHATDGKDWRTRVKDALALSLLTRVTGIKDLAEVATVTAELQALATIKYDAYEGYVPGVKFLESLAVWLDQFEEGERSAAFSFVRGRLVYMSPAEVDHLVASVYPDVIRPSLIRATANDLGVQPWRVAKVVASPEFLARQRRMLLLGLSDGARLDRLRRSSPLSTEQFHLVPQLDQGKAEEMAADLAAALKSRNLPGESSFNTVLLVDDFAGTGTSMVRQKGDDWTGKLIKARKRITDLKEQGWVSADARIVVLIYILTTRAARHVQSALEQSGLAAGGFELVGVHVLDGSFQLHDPDDGEFIALCRKYFRESWNTIHTKVGGDDLALGYGGCALPLVMHHNAPNNSPPIIWRDEMHDPTPENSAGTKQWVALFPRYERHHPGRP